jgi:diazepam-binding inhibitor (GABA receptor modulating acyl-CoA-binding protein)
MEEEFQIYCNLVKLLPKRPSDNDLLILYSLYKQANFGDNNTPEPGLFNVSAKKKWTAWKMIQGMEQQEAMTRYIDKVKELISNV